MEEEIPADLRRDALDVLSDVLVWSLTASAWERVDQALRAMEEAADAETFAKGVAELELAGPLRIRTQLGDHPEPAPEPVRDRVNRLREKHDDESDGQEEPSEDAG